MNAKPKLPTSKDLWITHGPGEGAEYYAFSKKPLKTQLLADGRWTGGMFLSESQAHAILPKGCWLEPGTGPKKIKVSVA